MRLFSLLIILSQLVSYAQDYIDIGKVEYTATPQNQYEELDASTALQKFGVNLTTPISLKNGNAILTGLVYDNITSGFVFPNEEFSLEAYTLKLGMNLKHSEKWSTTFLLLPKFASNDALAFSQEDFQFGGLLLVKNKSTEHLVYKYGAYLNSDQFGPFLVPLFGGYYQKDKLEIDAIIPSYARINYEVVPKLNLGINWRATVRSYNANNIVTIGTVQTPLYLHHLSNEIAGHVQYEPIKGIILRTMGGISLGRSFRLYEDDDVIDFGLSLFRFGDDRSQLNREIENGAFFRTEFAYRYYLK